MPRNYSSNPILNSPYEEPQQQWLLGEDGLPTGNIAGGRRRSEFFIPIPRSANRQNATELLGIGENEKERRPNPIVNFLRDELKKWRQTPIDQRDISAVTKRLLRHWHSGNSTPRPFFCQIEAVETLIWLNEVANKKHQGTREILDQIDEANREANDNLPRLAAKMATGAGKTTVMAMLIAYHAVNKSRQPKSDKYSDKFLVITPGITIRDRLRVLLPQDPNNYYEKSGIVPPDMVGDIKKATVIITNYHAFKHRETLNISKRQRQLLRGNDEQEIRTTEHDGKMLQRVCSELLRSKSNVVVLNDEAHHCYIHKKEDISEEKITDEDEKEEAKRNDATARLWFNGIRALSSKVSIKKVYDFSATPFFLRGSGYPEGNLFPWVVSDFSLMDAIESGIVKLPRVPIKDNAQTKEPIYRHLYKHVKGRLPRKGQQSHLDPQELPSELLGALQSLYDHYAEISRQWRESGIQVPPVFIIVCNNTSTSKLIYDYVSGYKVTSTDPNTPDTWRKGKFSLFNNVQEDGSGLQARPNTLLIDSTQLESGESLSDDFKQAAALEIEQFKQERRIRNPDLKIDQTKDVEDVDLLREVMNTVGKKGLLGEKIRCVVSVSMLTEGWDTNNVTHVLGVRAFGTQLLCEQVVGRALRRYSYDVQEDGDNAGQFLPEYADVYGVPFDFAPVEPPRPPLPPRPKYRVRHLPERDLLEITFPRVQGYREKPPQKKIVARFTGDSNLRITAADAPPISQQQGIVGQDQLLTLDTLKSHRINQVVYSIAALTARRYYKDEAGTIAPNYFRDLVPIVRQWLQRYVQCLDGTCKQYLLWQTIAHQAAERVYNSCTITEKQQKEIIPILDPFNPEGSSHYVDFLTTKQRLHEPPADKSHVNIAVCDSDWEVQFCELLDQTDGVFAYIRNEGLGFEVPYTHQNQNYQYRPDFIILIDDGQPDKLNLVVEIKGYRNGYAQAKADTMHKLWIPAINNDGRWGRWAFTEIMDPQYLRLDDSKTPNQVLQKYINNT